MAVDTIILYENPDVIDLYPFSIMHCNWEIRGGVYRNFQRIKHYFSKSKFGFRGRSLQMQLFLVKENLVNNTPEGNTLYYDGAVFPDSKIDEIQSIIENFSDKIIRFVNSGKAIALFVPAHYINEISFNDEPANINIFSHNDLIEIEVGGLPRYNYLWDTLDSVGDNINSDAKFISKHYQRLYLPQFHGIHALEPEHILLGKDVKIYPNVVLDASEGTIIIGNGVKIMPNVAIMGPCYIGDNSIVKVGAKIYGKSCFGEHCKIGGEIENTIIHSYSNKQHEGFLGHSYICEWVNIGADTNNSDLKNTYKSIKMRLPHRVVNTNKIFLGLFCGDHTKTAINTQFNTGTVIGISAMIFESGFLPTTIPSFEYGGSSNKKYNLDEAIETAQTMMSRRQIKLTNEEIEIFRAEYNKIIQA